MHMQYACACLEIDMFLHRSALQFQLNSATIEEKHLKSYLVYFLPTIVVVVLAQNMLQSHTTRVRYASYIVSFDFALSLITFWEFYEMRLKMMAKKVFVCLIQLPHIFAIKLSVHTLHTIRRVIRSIKK